MFGIDLGDDGGEVLLRGPPTDESVGRTRQFETTAFREVAGGAGIHQDGLHPSRELTHRFGADVHGRVCRQGDDFRADR